MTRAADLDALAISQALAAVDPRWGEHFGAGPGLLWLHPVTGATVVVAVGLINRVPWVCATITMGRDRRHGTAGDGILDALRGAIWGDGSCYVSYPSTDGGAVCLSGRADGQPSPFGPP